MSVFFFTFLAEQKQIGRQNMVLKKRNTAEHCKHTKQIDMVVLKQCSSTPCICLYTVEQTQLGYLFTPKVEGIGRGGGIEEKK